MAIHLDSGFYINLFEISIPEIKKIAESHFKNKKHVAAIFESLKN